MKKRLIIGAVIIVGIVAVLIPAYILFDIYNGARDYKQTLTSRHPENEPASREAKNKPTAGGDEGSPTEGGTEGGATQGKSESKPAAGRDEGDSDNAGIASEDIEIRLPGNNTINVLFMGLDRTEERDKTLGIYRSDTIAVANIDMDKKTVDVLCIPRDTYTYLPVRGKMDKINHAYAFGSIKDSGNESAVEAVESFIKYDKIDYYFTIDMEPVPEIVDSIGGVEVDVEIDINSHGVNLQKGKQLLDGKQALSYIRWRYSGDGDIGRIKRQQKLMAAMFNKLKKADQLGNAVKIVLDYKDSVSMNMSVKQIAALVMFAKEVPGDSIKFHIIPGEGKMINKVSYWVPDEKKTDQLLSEVFSQ